MRTNFVKLYGEIIHLKENKLFLNNFGIEDISEIEGLEKLSHLKELSLYLGDLRTGCPRDPSRDDSSYIISVPDQNSIMKIKNLEHLINLIDLDLSWNKIEKMRGLDTLINLQNLSLKDNKIKITAKAIVLNLIPFI